MTNHGSPGIDSVRAGAAGLLLFQGGDYTKGGGYPANYSAFDRFRRQFYSLVHPKDPHVLVRVLDVGNSL